MNTNLRVGLVRICKQEACHQGSLLLKAKGMDKLEFRQIETTKSQRIHIKTLTYRLSLMKSTRIVVKKWRVGKLIRSILLITEGH